MGEGGEEGENKDDGNSKDELKDLQGGGLEAVGGRVIGSEMSVRCSTLSSRFASTS